MSNNPHNPKVIKEIFDSLPTLDPSRPDLRIINIEILESVVRHAENRASLAASMNSLAQAKDIVQEVFGKSLASL